MASWRLSWTVVIVVLAVLVHQLGVFDRPPFHDAPVPNLYLVVATCRDGNFGKHIERLLTNTLAFASDKVSNGKERLETAAQSYNDVPATAKRLSVGLYFDNPSKVSNPRWAVGWALQAESLDDLKKEVADAAANQKEDKNECGSLRAVQVPAGVRRQARIPWRNALTPMIAPLLHWGRGFANVKEDDNAAYAMEVYVASFHGDNEKEKHEFIDYVVLADDAERIITAVFPTTGDTQQQEDARNRKEIPTEEAMVDE